MVLDKTITMLVKILRVVLLVTLLFTTIGCSLPPTTPTVVDIPSKHSGVGQIAVASFVDIDELNDFLAQRDIEIIQIVQEVIYGGLITTRYTVYYIK